MSKIPRNIVVTLIILLSTITTRVNATIINVPGDYSTIQEGIDAAVDGDTVLVAPGTYYEDIKVWFKDDHITILGSDAEVTTIHGSGSSHVIWFGQANVDVVGFTITNSGGYFYAGVFASQSNVIISDNIITDNNRAIFISSSSHAVIKNNIIMNSSDYWHSIQIITDGTTEMYNNLIIKGTGSNFIDIWTPISFPQIILNNTLPSTMDDGAFVASFGKFKNNIIINKYSVGIAIEAFDPSDTYIAYNDLWNNGTNYYNYLGGSFNPIPGTGEIHENPLFIDPGNDNYGLQADSPCIDSGDPDFDEDGIPWQRDPDDRDPDGTRLDMGYLYFDQSIYREITLTPIDTPIVIPPEGGSGSYHVMVSNTGMGDAYGQCWFMVTFPDGSVHGPVIGPVQGVLSAGGIIEREVEQHLGPNAPPGEYTYRGLIGIYPEDVWANDSFTFVKEGPNNIAKIFDKSGFSPDEWTAFDRETGEAIEPDDDWTDAELKESIEQSIQYGPVGITKDPVPEKYRLRTNYPNPFNANTIITFDLPELSRVQLTIYDLLGREIITLYNSFKVKGSHEVIWDGKDGAGNEVPSGVYIYNIRMASMERKKVFHQSRKLILLR